MFLSARMLDSVTSVNNYNNVDHVEFTEGDAVRVYFQLVDLSQDKVLQQYKPVGRRYAPAAGATLLVSLYNIDDAKAIVERTAAQPYAGDASIWYVDVAATDKVRGTVNMTLKLTEGAKVTRGRLDYALAIHGLGNL